MDQAPEVVPDDSFSIRIEKNPDSSQMMESLLSKALRKILDSPMGEVLSDFQKKISSKELQTRHFLWKVKHPECNIGGFQRKVQISAQNDDGDSRVVYKVIRSCGRWRQDKKTLILNYKNLILILHNLHLELLNKTKIQRCKYRAEHLKLFGWLDQQIFSPQHGFPIFFVSDKAIPSWNIGPAQKIIIEYLSQDKNIKFGHKTALILIGEYYSQSQITNT